MQDVLHILKELGYLLNAYEGKAKFCCDGKRCLHLHDDMKKLYNDLFVTVNRTISEAERNSTHG